MGFVLICNQPHDTAGICVSTIIFAIQLRWVFTCVTNGIIHTFKGEKSNVRWAV